MANKEDDEFARRARASTGQRAKVRAAVNGARVRIQRAVALGASDRAVYRMLKEDGFAVGAHFSSFRTALRYLEASDASWSNPEHTVAGAEQPEEPRSGDTGGADFGDTRFKSAY